MKKRFITALLFSTALGTVSAQDPANGYRLPNSFDLSSQFLQEGLQALAFINNIFLIQSDALQSEVEAKLVHQETLTACIMVQQDLEGKMLLVEGLVALNQKQMELANSALPETAFADFGKANLMAPKGVQLSRREVADFQPVVRQAWKLVFEKEMPTDPLAVRKFLMPAGQSQTLTIYK